MDPAVSVVIPAYRVTAYIAETVDSVLVQTFRDFEIVVVNDGCPDTANLEMVLAPYVAENRIRYIKQENRGLSGARNTGIRASRAGLVVVLDADDCLRPGALEIWREIILRSPETGMVYGNAIFFGGTPLDGHDAMKYFPSRSNHVTYTDLISRKAYSYACAMFRRDLLLELGLYDENLRKAEDYDMALRVARSGHGIENTNVVSWNYRIRPGSLSQTGGDIQTWRIRVLEKHYRDPDVNDADREVIGAELRYQNATQTLDEGKAALVNRDYALARSRVRAANLELRSPRLALVSALLLVMPGALRRFTLYRDGRSKRHNAPPGSGIS